MNYDSTFHVFLKLWYHFNFNSFGESCSDPSNKWTRFVAEGLRRVEDPGWVGTKVWWKLVEPRGDHWPWARQIWVTKLLLESTFCWLSCFEATFFKGRSKRILVEVCWIKITHCRSVFSNIWWLDVGSHVAGLPKRFFYVTLGFSLSGNSLHGAVEAMIVAWKGWEVGLRSLGTSSQCSSLATSTKTKSRYLKIEYDRRNTLQIRLISLWSNHTKPPCKLDRPRWTSEIGVSNLWLWQMSRVACGWPVSWDGRSWLHR